MPELRISEAVAVQIYRLVFHLSESSSVLNGIGMRGVYIILFRCSLVGVSTLLPGTAWPSGPQPTHEHEPPLGVVSCV